MKRMHIHVGVDSLEKSIEFYNALFGAEPVKTKIDYAKWMLDDPRVNFAISTRTGTQGVDHLGFQVDEESELQSIRESFQKADIETYDDGEAVCCYARSEKSWVRDPSGIPWETYQTMEDAALFHGKDAVGSSSCCAPEEKSNCC